MVAHQRIEDLQASQPVVAVNLLRDQYAGVMTGGGGATGTDLTVQAPTGMPVLNGDGTLTVPPANYSGAPDEQQVGTTATSAAAPPESTSTVTTAAPGTTVPTEVAPMVPNNGVLTGSASVNDQVSREYNAVMTALQNPTGSPDQLQQVLSQFGPTPAGMASGNTTNPAYQAWLAGYTPAQVQAAYAYEKAMAGPMVPMSLRMAALVPFVQGAQQALYNAQQQYQHDNPMPANDQGTLPTAQQAAADQTNGDGTQTGTDGTGTQTAADGTTPQTDANGQPIAPTDANGQPVAQTGNRQIVPTAGNRQIVPSTGNRQLTSSMVSPTDLSTPGAGSNPQLDAANQDFISQDTSQFNPNATASNPHCGPTSLAMALKLLKVLPEGQDPQHAEAIIDQLQNKLMQTQPADPRLQNHGPYTNLWQIQQLAQQAGCSADMVQGLSGINAALAQNKVVISAGNSIAYDARFGNNYETVNGQPFSGQHLICVEGRDKQTGNYIIGDPLSKVGALEITPAELQGFINGAQSINGTQVLHGGVALGRSGVTPATETG